MRMEKEFAGQFFSFISSLIDPRVGRLKKKKKEGISLKGTRARILYSPV